MAEPERTERATPKRRAKARRDGSVARSPEINQTAVLLATFAAIAITAPRLLARSEAIMHDGLARTGDPNLVDGGNGLGGVSSWAIHSALLAVAPVMLAAAAAGLLASVGQVGLKFSWKAVTPSFNRLNPATGLKQLFSPRKATELAKSLAKLAIVGGIAGWTVWSRLPRFGLLVGMPPGAILIELFHLLVSIVVRVAAPLVAIAAADYAWQKRQFEQRIRMTKEEVKQESKEGNLPAEVRHKLRQKQAEQAQRRMMAAVPTADVVVVNPTHFAVALAYDGSKAAPEVVAKGVDHVALRIRALAEEAGVTVVHEPPLARALHRDVEVGHQIPEELFGAVAEVLAFVFRAARRYRARRALNA